MNLLAELLISLMLGFAVTIQGDGQGDEREPIPLWLLELPDYGKYFGETKGNEELSHTSLPEGKPVRQRSLLRPPFDNAAEFRVYNEDEGVDDLLGYGSLPEWKNVHQRSLLHSPFVNSRINHVYGRFHPRQTATSFEEDLDNVGRTHVRDIADHLHSRAPTGNTHYRVSIRPGVYDHHLPGSAVPSEVSQIPSETHTSGHNIRLSGHEHLLKHPAFSPSEADFGRLGFGIQDTHTSRRYLPSRISQKAKIGLGNILGKVTRHTLKGEDKKEEADRFGRRVAAQVAMNATEYAKDIAVKTIEEITEGIMTFFDRMFNVQRHPKSTNTTSSQLPPTIINPLFKTGVAGIGNVITHVARYGNRDHKNAALENLLDAPKQSADKVAEKLSQNSSFIDRARETSSSNRNLLNVLKSVVEKFVPELVAKYDDPQVQQFMDLFLEELLFYSSVYCNAKTSGISKVPQRDIMLYRRYIRNKMDQMNS